MSCNPELVTGYVDGALDGPSMAELKSHLETCATCREQAAFEVSLRERLRELALLEPSLDLRERVLARARPRRRVLAWILAAPAAAALVAFMVIRMSPSFLSWELVQDHVRCFGLKPLKENVLAGAPEELARAFKENGNPIPEPPAVAGKLQLLGGRQCQLFDRVWVAHLLYLGGDHEASVFVLPDRRGLGDGYVTRSGSLTIDLVQLPAHTVGIVATSLEDALSLRSALLQQSRASNTDAHRPAIFLTSNARPANIFFSADGAVAQLGARVNGIHEVMGSIPISSTNSSNNLAGQRIGDISDLSISCLFSGRTP